VSVVFPWSTWPIVPIFKWGNDRSKVVARPLFHALKESFGATERVVGLRETSLEALRRNVGTLLKRDIPVIQRPLSTIRGVKMER
jgi:hypothetical protein